MSGGSWGTLRGVRGCLGAILEAILRQRDFRTFFESILGPSWAPKGGSNGAQVGPKTDQNRRRKRRCQKKFFRLVLGRSWSRLGAILGPSWPNLRPSWGDLGAAGGGQNHCFSLSFFEYFFEKSLFRIKMVIMGGLGAILVSPSLFPRPWSNRPGESPTAPFPLLIAPQLHST